MKEMTIEDLKKEKNVYIYGLGRLGKKVCCFLELLNIPISGILVSSMLGNPNTYHGNDVSVIEKCQVEKGALILVTVPESATASVCYLLEEAGCTRYIIWDKKKFSSIWKEFPHQFIDRRKNGDKVLFVLSGYKRNLWGFVFERVSRFVPSDIEVCICSSGVFDNELASVAKRNNWSYLSTSMNSITLIQNIAYSLYQKYTWIYKMDEDIFLTEGALENLYRAYQRAQKKEPYHVGVLAPIIPLNEYGCRNVLLKYGCLGDFEERYGKLYFGGDGMIVNTEDIALYMWGKYGQLPKLDQMNKDFQDDILVTCATRYNIGLILFNRSFWENMYCFSVSGGVDMGVDEEEICAWCVNMSHALLVTYNVVVGHFAFGPQEKCMKKYFKESPENF